MFVNQDGRDYLIQLLRVLDGKTTIQIVKNDTSHNLIFRGYVYQLWDAEWAMNYRYIIHEIEFLGVSEVYVVVSEYQRKHTN